MTPPLRHPSARAAARLERGRVAGAASSVERGLVWHMGGGIASARAGCAVRDALVVGPALLWCMVGLGDTMLLMQVSASTLCEGRKERRKNCDMK